MTPYKWMSLLVGERKCLRSLVRITEYDVTQAALADDNVRGSSVT